MNSTWLKIFNDCTFVHRWYIIRDMRVRFPYPNSSSSSDRCLFHVTIWILNVNNTICHFAQVFYQMLNVLFIVLLTLTFVSHFLATHIGKHRYVCKCIWIMYTEESEVNDTNFHTKLLCCTYEVLKYILYIKPKPKSTMCF